MNHKPRIIIALDYDDIKQARALIAKLDPALSRLKIGKTMFTRFGPAFVEELQRKNFDVFLDLKFHDIPNTVAGAVKAAADLGVWMVNVHAMGGKKMLEAAVNALAHYHQRPLLIGVTILTSMQNEDLKLLGIHDSITTLVPRLAKLTAECGLDGVVCSAHEIQSIRQTTPEEFLTVTPGIRLTNDNAQDQKRVMTPEQAIKAGSDFLVIGRSITQAEHPLQVLEKINLYTQND